jgi:hypothetical protein
MLPKELSQHLRWRVVGHIIGPHEIVRRTQR